MAAALDGEGLLVLVPDAQMAVDVLAQAAAQAECPATRGARRTARSARGRPPPGDRHLGGLPLDVSHLELEVLGCLAASPGVVWTYEELHEAAWGTRYVGDRDSVYSLVKRLRRKLAEAGSSSTWWPYAASDSSSCHSLRHARSTRRSSQTARPEAG